MKFYPDISASDQVIQIAIAQLSKMTEEEALGPRLLSENKFCLDLIWVSRSVTDTQYVVINMYVYQKKCLLR